MAMVPFHERMRELALNETRSVKVEGTAGLPAGEYGFLELYCDDPACDCQRVMIDVISPQHPREILAVINYGWESAEFYRRWIGKGKSLISDDTARQAQGPLLDPLNKQGDHAPALLRLFQMLIQDEKYVQRLKRHYMLFRSAKPAERPVPVQAKKKRKHKSR
jgi:hypothetical protein